MNVIAAYVRKFLDNVNRAVMVMLVLVMAEKGITIAGIEALVVMSIVSRIVAKIESRR